MDGKDSKNEDKVVGFPGAEEHSERGRAARVRTLRKRVASGQYRLDAAAVAAAMLSEGVFKPTRDIAAEEAVEEPGRSKARFVVRREESPEAEPRRAAPGA